MLLSFNTLFHTNKFTVNNIQKQIILKNIGLIDLKNQDIVKFQKNHFSTIYYLLIVTIRF